MTIYITESTDKQLQQSIAFSLMYELEFSDISKGIQSGQTLSCVLLTLNSNRVEQQVDF